MKLELDGQSLLASEVVAVATAPKGHWPLVLLSAESRQRLATARQYVEDHWLKADARPIYGFNTGVGKLKDSAIALEQIDLFQEMLINSHSAGVGKPLPEDVVRAILILRANTFARGCSGVRPELVDRLLALLNRGVHPVIPELGSVGASGDLAPLAHMAGTLVGHPQAEAFFDGRRMPATEALDAAGIDPIQFKLGAKEGLALINGSTVSLAIAILAKHQAELALAHAEIALALSLEGMRGELAAFDPRIQEARPHHGQSKTAEIVRRLTDGSQRCTESARQVALPDEGRMPAQTISARVQDAYSLRCAPQVHGPVRHALEYVQSILATEINSSTDNPLIFETEKGYDVLSGGNFHGQYLAQAMDLLAMAMTDLGSISERRAHRLLDPTMSYGLPSNLVAKLPGLNTGYSIAHCSMAALVAENKTLCWPTSVDSIPTKSNQEDHISNSTWSARKARTVIDNVQQIVATEMLMAAQAISLTEPVLSQFSLGRGSAAALAALRERIPAALEGDRWLHADLVAALELLRSGAVLRAVEQAIGPIR
ncbi:MAG TPA: histidine ammonia-lyase [Anaerolineae bacterium]|nr:histidine ammonia-lyase [Anaerolineae bacterium]